MPRYVIERHYGLVDDEMQELAARSKLIGIERSRRTSNSRPTTAPIVSSWRQSSPNRARRCLITSRAAAGTSERRP
jgi:hypothetical protein